MLKLTALQSYIGKPAKFTGDGILLLTPEGQGELEKGPNLVCLHHSLEIPTGYFMLGHLWPKLQDQGIWMSSCVWSDAYHPKMEISIFSPYEVELPRGGNLVLFTLHKKEPMQCYYTHANGMTECLSL